MPATKAAITKTAEPNEIETQTTSFIARPNGANNTTTITIPQAQALLIQELEVNFDPDLRMAMLERLVQAQKEINSLASQEQQLSKVIELSRLAAAEKGKEAGKQLARAEFAEKLKKQLQQEQQKFIKIDLPKLIEACQFLEEADMKATVASFASRLKIQINWEQTDEGLKCTPVIA